MMRDKLTLDISHDNQVCLSRFTIKIISGSITYAIYLILKPETVWAIMARVRAYRSIVSTQTLSCCIKRSTSNPFWNYLQLSYMYMKFFYKIYNGKRIRQCQPFLGFRPLSYRPFHKTLPRSSAFVNWILVRFYETGCRKTYNL